MSWLYANVLRDSGITAEGVAVLGDEDELIDNVTHVGVGPDLFIDFLDWQATLAAFMSKRPPDPAWVVVQEGFAPSRERHMESLFLVGNGYLCIRGSTTLPFPSEQGDLFLAGIYDSKASAYFPGFKVMLPKDSKDAEIVPFPSPFRLRVLVGDTELRPGDSDMRYFERRLNLRSGTLTEAYVFEDLAGRRTSLEIDRVACLHDRHLLLMEARIRCENHASPIELFHGPDFSDLRINHPHLRPPSADADGNIRFITRQSGGEAAFASRAWLDGTPLPSDKIRFDGRPDETSVFRKTIAVYTSRDDSDPVKAASRRAGLETAETQNFHVNEHERRWSLFWHRADMTFEATAITQAARFGTYHLRIAADHDPCVSIPARALSGRGYDGHVFWDVEIFMLPFYIYNTPAIARDLLLYRYNTLDGARARAREMGCLGACFAWESTLSGQDVTPVKMISRTTGQEIPILTGQQQLHVTSAVAFAVQRYWDATLDDDFLLDFGMEILAETARFWTSRAVARGGARHIEKVIGPDEYHQSVDDNYYTCFMAIHNLRTAAKTARCLKTRYPEKWAKVEERLEIEKDLGGWEDTARDLCLPPPRFDGVIEQFRGFFRLRDVPLTRTKGLHMPVDRLINWKEVNRMQLLKQADVLMVPFLFPDAFPPEVLRSSFDYYESRTEHGSSLSPCVHAAVAAQLGRADLLAEFGELALGIDLFNEMNNTELGIHAASLGGTWQALVFHIVGVEFHEGEIRIRPGLEERLPSPWTPVSFRLRYRGTSYRVSVNADKTAEISAEVSLDASGDVLIDTTGERSTAA